MLQFVKLCMNPVSVSQETRWYMGQPLRIHASLETRAIFMAAIYTRIKLCTRSSGEKTASLNEYIKYSVGRSLFLLILRMRSVSRRSLIDKRALLFHATAEWYFCSVPFIYWQSWMTQNETCRQLKINLFVSRVEMSQSTRDRIVSLASSRQTSSSKERHLVRKGNERNRAEVSFGRSMEQQSSFVNQAFF